MTRISKNPEVRMNEILDSAQGLFCSCGYYKTAVSEIVKNVGVSQGTFYYYFKSKEDVLEIIVKREISRRVFELQTVISDISLNPWGKVQKVINTMLNSVQCEGLQFEYLYNEQYLHVLDRISRQTDESLSPFLVKIVEDGVSSGDFKTTHPQEAVDFLLAIIRTLVFSLHKKYTEKQFKYQREIAKRILGEVLEVSD